MDGPESILFLLFLLVVSGLFSGAETAMMSLEMSKIKALKPSRSKSIVEWLKNHPQKVIITLLIVNNVLNTLITVLATLIAANIAANGSNADIVMASVTIIISILLIIFGDVLPKSIAVAHSKAYTFLVAPAVFFLIKIFTPFIFILEYLINLLTPHSHHKVTEEEVLAMVSMGEEHGEITKEEKNQIESLLEFSETTVEEIMTPRIKIDAIASDASLEEAKQIFLEGTHTRLPVYDDTIDTIVKIMTLRDMMEEIDQGHLDKKVSELNLKTPYFVPITKKLSDLLREFQLQKTHVAIVVDEYGGTAGLVTMEDIFEEIFGDIQDETDDEEDIPFDQLNDTSWRISSRITLGEVLEQTKVMISPDEDDHEKSISLYILEQLGRFPHADEKIELETCTLVIEKIGDKTVEQIRMVQK